MALPAQIFDNVTQAQFDALCAKVKAATGIAVDGNQGQRSQKGWTISWNFAPPQLTVQVINKPWEDPAGMVEETIANWVTTAA